MKPEKGIQDVLRYEAPKIKLVLLKTKTNTHPKLVSPSSEAQDMSQANVRTKQKSQGHLSRLWYSDHPFTGISSHREPSPQSTQPAGLYAPMPTSQ